MSITAALATAGAPAADRPHTAALGRVDLSTVAGVAAVVYVLSTLLHEAAGHGLACLAVGAPPRVWGAYYFDCDFRGLPASAGRVAAAAGSTVNLLVALACLAQWRRVSDATGSARLFVWLAFTVNAFQWAGYFLFSGVAGFGDWGTRGVLAGITHPLVGRALLVAGGAGLYYVLIPRRAAAMLGDFLGGTPEGRRAGRRTAMMAYAAGGLVSVLVGSLNPVGLAVVLLSAVAASLGGTVGLLYVALGMPRDGRPARSGVARSWPWIAAGAAAALAYAAVLGPSIHFAR